jgi:hypothetical protein
MITPTIGRRVWFWPAVGTYGKLEQPFDAGIAYVHGDRCINIGFRDHNGTVGSATSVPLLQDDDKVPENGFCCQWMPYQAAQAAKQGVVT